MDETSEMDYSRYTDDELIDVLLFGTPKSWQNEMDRQGFDPMEKTITAVVEFMENIESTETFEPTSKKTPTSKKSSGTKKSKTSDSEDGKKPPHYCTQHGANWTHDTKDCRFLQNQGKSDSKGKYQNKSWDRKSAEASANSKKELAALIAKTVKKSVKQQLASVDKKRKSSDDDKDCYLVDALTQELDGFNYEDMDKLTIDDSDDEVSV